MRTTLAFSVAILLSAALIACGKAPDSADSNSQPQPQLTGNAAPTAVPSGATLAPGEWRVSENAEGVAAIFDEAGNRPILTLWCNRASGQVSVERPGSLQPGDEHSIIAGGERFILPMQASTSALPTMAAQVNPQQPILAAMAIQGSTFSLLGPGDARLELPASPGIRRVIDTCLTS